MRISTDVAWDRGSTGAQVRRLEAEAKAYSPTMSSEAGSSPLSLPPRLEAKFVARSRAYGKDPSLWLQSAVQQRLSEWPEPLGDPPEPQAPLFTYGSLKPGELAHSQISANVTRADDAHLPGHHLRTRDGLPILVPGGEFVVGSLVAFRDPLAGYDVVRRFEPRPHYHWTQVTVQFGNGQALANTLLAELPEEGTENEALESWSATRDPVLVEGLIQTAELARPILEKPWHGTPFEGDFARDFFQLEAAFLLLMSAVERLATFVFGTGISPTARVSNLEKLDGFPEWWRTAGGRPGRRVIDSRDPSRAFTIGEDGAGAWEYWYAVRSNLAHRGKGAWKDAGIVRDAFVECYQVVRLTLKGLVPAFADRWPDS